jgi:hypothetical protein
MNFSDLLTRLLDELRHRVSSGTTTERRLALLAGLSQPHLHHVLKGKRQLSIAAADEILRRLEIDLADLISIEELQQRQRRG